MKRRFLSVLLALVMCLSLLPTAALAEDRVLTASTTHLRSSHKYTLNEDVTLDNGQDYLIVDTDADATLDLNGHVLTGCGSYVIYYGNKDRTTPATLTLTDSDPTAEHYFTVDSTGRWSLCPTEGHTHDATCRKVTGGCIVGDSTTYCVNVSGAAKTFIMEGGTLIGGQDNYSRGVLVSGSFIMKGGSIQGCKSPNFGSVVVSSGAQITLGGDPTKTVTIEDASAGGSGVWLNNAAPAAKLTVGEMKAGSSFTVSRGDGAKLTYVGDLDLTGDSPTLPAGVSWNSSKNELTLTDVCCGTVKLPCDSTIKGNGYAELIRSEGTIEGNLTFDGATIEVGSIMWHHNDAGPKIILKNGSTLTATGEDGLYAGGYDIQDSSTLVLDGAPISSNSAGVIDDLNDCLPDGKAYYANNEEIAKYLHKTEDSTEKSDRVTSETFRRYCEVTFYPGTRGEFAEGTKTELRVPYGSKVTPPTATPNSPNDFAFAGWEREENSEAVDTTIDDPITADRVAFTAQYQQIVTESFPYTNNVVLDGTAAPTAQDFELEVIDRYQSPITTATVSGNTTQVTATTTFNKDTTGITQAALTGTLTLQGLSDDIFPCFVRQKYMTADGWTTATEAYLLAYDTQIEQGEEEEYPFEGDGGANPLRLATPNDPPTLKIYPAESGENAEYQITSNNGVAVPVDTMTFTNTYTGYNVTWDVNGGDTPYTPAGATTSGTVGTTIVKPTNDPTRSDYDFDGWYTAATGGDALTNTSTISQGDVTYYAHWVKTPIYNVTWNAGYGGTIDTTGATTSGKVGTPIIAPADPTRPDEGNVKYTFQKWRSSRSQEDYTTSDTIPEGGVTYYAMWSSAYYYDVTWDVNGGDTPYTPADATTSGTAGTPITAPSNPPTRAADASNVYTFAGWYTAATGGTKLDATAAIPQGNVTYYAHWNKTRTYNVNWDGNGGTVDTTGATTSGTAGTPITAPTDPPTRAADDDFVYTFAGWYRLPEGGLPYEAIDTIGMFDVTYYAHWNKTPIYTVTFESNGGSAVSPLKVKSGDKAAEPTDPTKSGYGFGGWYSDANLSSAYDFETAVTSDLTLYARWMSNSSGTRYTIKASAGEGGSITPSGNVSVRRGADRSFTITPALGYAVRSVLVDGKEVGALTSYSFKNVRANHTISVTFQCNLPTGLNYLDHTAYVQGYPDGTVLPNGNITRAETAMMLYRLLTAERRAEIETSDCDLTDVSADAWYRTAAATMAAGGYLEGYADGSFGGDRSITRAEFIAALVRFLGVRDVTCSFSDVPASHWAYAYVATATDAGWINGANGAFRPDDPITRAEAMAVINRALCRGVDAESELLTFKGYPDNVFGAWYYYEVLEATNGHEYTGARPSEDWTRLL